MARRKRQDNGSVIFEEKCKVCKSKFKNLVEDLHNQGLRPRQIMDYLKGLSDPKEKEQLEQEGLSESSIRRHLDRHYNLKTGASIKIAETKNRLARSREAFKQGVHMKVDSIATLSHMIDVALINIEDLDSMPDGRQKHQLTINYMTTIKNLIDEFSKLTGELKQEGTIDVNFFSNQITEFANIVLATVKKLDDQFGMNSKLEYAFGTEFQKQWTTYKETQQKMISGELPLDYGAKDRNINTFNDRSAQ